MRVTSVGNCAACDEISFEFCTFTNLDCYCSSSNLSFQSKFIILVGKFSLFFRLPAVCIFISWRNSRQKIRVNRSSSPLWHIQWTIASADVRRLITPFAALFAFSTDFKTMFILGMLLLRIVSFERAVQALATFLIMHNLPFTVFGCHSASSSVCSDVVASGRLRGEWAFVSYWHSYCN